MAQKITYSNKEAMIVDPVIAENLKIKAEDMNEIKAVINTNADVQVSSSDASVVNIRKVTEDWYRANYDSLLDNTIYITDGQSYAASTSAPVGSIIIWPGQSNKIPNNYMLCEGQLLDRNEYRVLFEAIGTTYGSGDGSTTFAIPNYKGLHPVHLDGTTEFATLNQKGGHKLLQAHRHFLAAKGAITSGTDLSANPNSSLAYYATSAASDLPYSLRASTDTEALYGRTGTAGAGNAENLSPYIVGYYIIKVRTEAFTEDVRSLDNELILAKARIASLENSKTKYGFIKVGRTANQVLGNGVTTNYVPTVIFDGANYTGIATLNANGSITFSERVREVRASLYLTADHEGMINTYAILWSQQYPVQFRNGMMHVFYNNSATAGSLTVPIWGNGRTLTFDSYWNYLVCYFTYV